MAWQYIISEATVVIIGTHAEEVSLYPFSLAKAVAIALLSGGSGADCL